MQNFAAPTFGLESPAARRSLVLLCLLLQFFQCALLPRTTALTARRFFPKADAKLHPFPITTKSSPFFSLVLTGFNKEKRANHCKKQAQHGSNIGLPTCSIAIYHSIRKIPQSGITFKYASRPFLMQRPEVVTDAAMQRCQFWRLEGLRLVTPQSSRSKERIIHARPMCRASIASSPSRSAIVRATRSIRS